MFRTRSICAGALLLMVLPLPAALEAGTYLSKAGAKKKPERERPTSGLPSRQPLVLPAGVLRFGLGLDEIFQKFPPTSFSPDGWTQRSTFELGATAGLVDAFQLSISFDPKLLLFGTYPGDRPRLIPTLAGRLRIYEGVVALAVEYQLRMDFRSFFPVHRPALRVRAPLGEGWRLDGALEWTFGTGRWNQQLGTIWLPFSVTRDLPHHLFVALSSALGPFTRYTGSVTFPLGLRAGGRLGREGSLALFELSVSASLPNFLRVPPPIEIAGEIIIVDPETAPRESPFSFRTIVVGVQLVIYYDPMPRKGPAPAQEQLPEDPAP